MAQLALIYPNISNEDLNKIQSLRKIWDKKYFSVVQPHITLVFGTDKLSSEELTDHVKNKLAEFNKFRLVFDSVRIIEDDSKEFHHAFLIPSEGFKDIDEVHDVLYTDDLESELRKDIPFIPHLGIGSDDDELQMAKLANDLNGNISIKGSADVVTIVEYDGNKVIDKYNVPLG